MDKDYRDKGDMPANEGESKRKRQRTREQARQELRSLLEQIAEGDVGTRINGWAQITRIIRSQPGAATIELVADLLHAQTREKDTDALAWRTAAEAISHAYFDLALVHGQLPGASATGNERVAGPAAAWVLPSCGCAALEGLGGWLWRDFKDRSFVLRVADPDRMRRDEEAVILIARWLPHVQFPYTEFLCIDPGGFAPTATHLDSVGALCFVGRLCLFGPEAVKSWGKIEPAPRHEFGMEFRPKNLARGKLHPKYHSIKETAPGQARKKIHRTADKDGSRRDFGLVRRYFIEWAGTPHPVIHIAGCSALGTLAAAHFATHELFNKRPDGKPWPLPPNITEYSRLEALIEATAELAGSEIAWRLGNTKVLDLRIDNYVWDEDEKTWQRDRADEILIDLRKCSRDGGYRREPQNAVIRVNGKVKEFQPDSENRRLCLELCMRAKRQGGKVSVDDLAKDTWIWKDRKAKDPAYVRNRNHYLLRQLGDSVEFHDGVYHVNARIEVIGSDVASRNGVLRR